MAFDLHLDRTALVVVDMQNDFVRETAPLEVPEARATIPANRRLADFFRSHGRPVIFTKFLAGPKYTLMWEWSPECAPPTCCCWRNFKRYYPDVGRELEVTDIIDELAPQPPDYKVEKYGYSAFHNTTVPDILAAEHCDTIVITGTVTQLCVEDTARGAFHHGIKAVVVSDAVSSYLPGLHASALENHGRKFGRTMTADELLAALA